MCSVDSLFRLLYFAMFFFFFFFNDTATTEIYTLSLHDALPISSVLQSPLRAPALPAPPVLGEVSERAAEAPSDSKEPAVLPLVGEGQAQGQGLAGDVRLVGLAESRGCAGP